MTHPILELIDHIDTLIDSDLEVAMNNLHEGSYDVPNAPDDILTIWNLQDETRDLFKNDPTNPKLLTNLSILWSASIALAAKQ